MPRSKKTKRAVVIKKITPALQPKNEDARVNAAFSENALKMMRKRYLLTRDDGSQEAPADMFRRIAHALAGIEKNYEHDSRFIGKIERDFFEIMANKEYTPAGRTLTNAGTETPLIANCIVLPIMDSMESIFGTLKDAALLQQAGSGLGFDFSHLRPAMSPTKKSRGVSSGPVSFLKVYNEAFGIIKQQGRHGANMAMMRVDHPDVLDFIRAKEIEGEIRNFNISVQITDEFMKALLERPNTQWYCAWNGKKMKPHKVIRAKNGSVTAFEEIDITVKQIFDEIIRYAWLNGEPGVFFVDEVNRTNPLPGLGPIDCTNPCVTGDTLIPTEKGFLTMEELALSYPNGTINIATDGRAYELLGRPPLNDEGGTLKTVAKISTICSINAASKIWLSGIKPVYRLTTQSGYEITATADHRVLTTKGKVAISELTKNHEILIQPGEGIWSANDKLHFGVTNVIHGKNGRIYNFNLPNTWSVELGRVLGWLIGDGWLRDKHKENMVGFTFAESDKSVLEYLKPIINSWYNYPIQEIKRENGVYHLDYSSKVFVEYMKALGVKPVDAREKEVPRAIFTAPRYAVVGFLQGLFGSDGTIANDLKKGNRYVRLTSKSRKLLQQVQILLLNFGIKSRIYDRSRPPRSLFPYTAKDGTKRIYVSDGILYELQISSQSLPRFVSEIGFIANKHAEMVNGLSRHEYYRQYFTEKIGSIVYVGEEKVYDLTEPATTTFIANGLTISNCGEQALHHYDNCNLGSVNLAAFVKTGKIDWNRLRFVTKTAVRLMDNVIDLFDFPVKQVTDLARKNRRIGLGIMGFADMLYQLGIGYNTTEGIKTAEKVMEAINEAAHQASQELAKEKGVFPNIGLSVFAKKTKIRNAALTTVAPTGSISMMFDCSSGVEPNFALSYVKQDKDGHQYHYFNRYFETELASAKLSKEKIKEAHDAVIKTGSIQSLSWLPEEFRKTFVVAMDISAEDHVKMQAAFQRHVDNSISKTINFPNSASLEEVEQGFVLAWKLKCKACTVYRDGSRNVQILNLGTGENIISPTELSAGQELGAAKKLEAPPLELAMDKNRLAPRNRPEIMHGRTYKIKTGYGNLYVTINDDQTRVPFEVFATIGKSGGFFQEQSEAICRMISLALRSGIKVESVIEQLKGIRGPMPVLTEKGTVLSLPDAIGQIMEEHAKSTNGKTDHAAEGELVAVAPQEKAEMHETQSQKKELADYGLMPGCPDCGAQLTMGEGCLSCRSCGFTRCL